MVLTEIGRRLVEEELVNKDNLDVTVFATGATGTQAYVEMVNEKIPNYKRVMTEGDMIDSFGPLATQFSVKTFFSFDDASTKYKKNFQIPVATGEKENHHSILTYVHGMKAIENDQAEITPIMSD